MGLPARMTLLEYQCRFVHLDFLLYDWLKARS
jgi:hypothetical protein